MAKSQRGRSKNKRRGGRFLSIIAVFVMLLYVPALWRWFLTPEMETGIIQEDILSIEIPIEGLLIRNEALLISPGEGTIVPEAHSGERLPVNGVIASFLESGEEGVFRQYKSAEADLLRRMVTEADIQASSEARALNRLNNVQAAELAIASNEGNITEVSNLRMSIGRRLDEQIRVLLDGSLDIEGLADEKQELARLKVRMNNAVSPINADRPGIVSYSFDGYETVWTPELIPSLTYGALLWQPKSIGSQSDWATPEQISVNTGEPFGKLVQNDEGWFVFSLDAESADWLALELGNAELAKKTYYVDIELEGIIDSISIELLRVTTAENSAGEAFAVGRFTRRVEQTMNKRRASGSLLLSRLEGMKVPKMALFNENRVDSTADILLVRINETALRRVKVLGIQDSWAIIENLPDTNMNDRVAVHDLYIQNPRDIREGETVLR